MAEYYDNRFNKSPKINLGLLKAMLGVFIGAISAFSSKEEISELRQRRLTLQKELPLKLLL